MIRRCSSSVGKDFITARPIGAGFAWGNRGWPPADVGMKLGENGWLSKFRPCYDPDFGPTRCDALHFGAKDTGPARSRRRLRQGAARDGREHMIDIEQIGAGAHRIAVYGEFHEDDARAFVEFAKEHHAAGKGGNVLIDLVSLASWSFSAMSEELVHIPALLRWIYSLDRIALVSDEEWMRNAARLESALLPGVSYAVYDEDEIDAARAWVLGEIDHPHGGAVNELDLGDDIAGFELVGRLDREEAEGVLDKVRARMVGTDCSKLMVVIRKWHGFEADAALSRHAMSSKIDLLKHCDRYAVVGGPDWLRAMAVTFGSLVKPEVRTFELDEEDEALRWLRR